MANIRFAGTELDTLGVTVRRLNARELAGWRAERVYIPGADAIAELGGHFDPETKTSISGNLTAPVEPFSSHTKAQWKTRLDSLKALLDPEAGYQQLVVSGDGSTDFRWCRYSEMQVEEDFPVFKRPFTPLTIGFDNLEPFWRRTHATVSGAAATLNIPYAGTRPGRPRITLTLTAAISTQVNLFTIGSLTVSWAGTLVPLSSTDKIIIDADALTVQHQPGGTGVLKDAIRAYGYNVYTDGGFPTLPKLTTSVISAKHASVGTVAVDYDERFS